MKNTRRAKMDRVRTGGARTQAGMSVDMRAQIAYWTAYLEFLERMSQDPRFILITEWV